MIMISVAPLSFAFHLIHRDLLWISRPYACMHLTPPQNTALFPPNSPTQNMNLLQTPLSHPKLHFLLPPQALSSSSSSSTTSPSSPPTALIVGAGLAGLAAASHLHSTNTPFLLLESSDAPGGRVRTDTLDGFLLDRGFQIFLTAYPESRRLLHYPSLQLRPFYPGTLVYHGGRLHRLSDPFRRPLSSLPSLLNPIGNLPDKLLVALSRLRFASLPDPLLLSASPETSTADLLRSSGFSPSIIDRFFTPFLGGIFFDLELSTTSRLYSFIIKCLALGDNALPAAGIAAIPNQLASRLPPGSLRLNSRAVEVGPDTVKLQSGEVLHGELGVIVAVNQPEAEKLLPSLKRSAPDPRPRRTRSTACLYFAAERAAVEDPILILNGSGKGIVNNMFFASNVVPSYAPEGKTLVSVSLVGDYGGWGEEELTAEVVRELGVWFGEGEVRGWRHLRTYRIGYAQPDMSPPTELVGRDPRVEEGVFVCGDYMSTPTFDGALVSGRRAAEALIQDRKAS